MCCQQFFLHYLVCQLMRRGWLLLDLRKNQSGERKRKCWGWMWNWRKKWHKVVMIVEQNEAQTAMKKMYQHCQDFKLTCFISRIKIIMCYHLHCPKKISHSWLWWWQHKKIVTTNVKTNCQVRVITAVTIVKKSHNCIRSDDCHATK